MTEPANYQAVIDALARASVGLADVMRVEEGFGWNRDIIKIVVAPTADASLHPASREELYELAMCYFADRLAEMRGSTAIVDQPTPRDRVVRIATKIRKRELLGRMNSYEQVGFTSVDIDLFKELKAAVDAMEGK